MTNQVIYQKKETLQRGQYNITGVMTNKHNKNCLFQQKTVYKPIWKMNTKLSSSSWSYHDHTGSWSERYRISKSMQHTSFICLSDAFKQTEKYYHILEMQVWPKKELQITNLQSS